MVSLGAGPEDIFGVATFALMLFRLLSAITSIHHSSAFPYSLARRRVDSCKHQNPWSQAGESVSESIGAFVKLRFFCTAGGDDKVFVVLSLNLC